ncbi:MAG: DUF3775 domain-containing protein [Alphaproteobacteria bacterium]|nr:DUF3775 domain-containing protein [Alphaproteobacteria bacterium]
MLTINPDTVCYVIVKARELFVKVAPEGLHDDADDVERILEDYADDPTSQEVRQFLDTQNEDALNELLALMWVGRGEYGVDDWQTALDAANNLRHRHPIDYLLATPLLADYLEEGLSQFGKSCEGFEMGRM